MVASDVLYLRQDVLQVHQGDVHLVADGFDDSGVVDGVMHQGLELRELSAVFVLHEAVHDGDLVVDVHAELVAVHQQAVGGIGLGNAGPGFVGAKLVAFQRLPHFLEAYATASVRLRGLET